MVWTQPTHPPAAPGSLPCIQPCIPPPGGSGQATAETAGCNNSHPAFHHKQLGTGVPFGPSPASPGVICPVNARGLIIGSKVGFVQDESVELSLPPRGVVHLSDVALRDDKLPMAEMGAIDTEQWRGLRPAQGLWEDSLSALRPVSYDGQSWGPASHPPRAPSSPTGIQAKGGRWTVREELDTPCRPRHTSAQSRGPTGQAPRPGQAQTALGATERKRWALHDGAPGRWMPL